MEQLPGFRKATAIQMLKNLFISYGEIRKIYLEEKGVKMMGPYDPAEPLTRLIDQLEKLWEFAISEGNTIADEMIVSKGITILAQTTTFNEEIWEWRWKSTNIKTWEGFKKFYSERIENI